MKAKEAKNVGEILEALPTFRQLADAYVSNSGVSALQACEAGRKMGAQPCAGLSRLAVGLAIRQVHFRYFQQCLDAVNLPQERILPMRDSIVTLLVH